MSGFTSQVPRWSAAILLAAFVAAAWRTVSLTPPAPADFVFNNAYEVQTLDPATVTGVPEGRVLRALFEGLLVKHPETLEPLPGGATHWDISPDGRTYTFHIRQGARWTNGDALTAHDWVYSWQRVLHPETAAEYAYQLWSVVGAKAYSTELDEGGRPLHSFDSVGIRALDDVTLEVELVAPTPYFLDLAGFYALMPVNRRNIEEARERSPDHWELEWLKPENIVTNGPFRVQERRVNDRIRLVKNEHYWDADNVAMNTIDFLAVESQVTGLNMYLTGETHLQPNVPALLVPDMLERPDFQPRPYLATYFYRCNVTRPPLDDPRVRRALALTIDRDAVCRNITKGGQQPATSLVPPGIPGYEPAPFADGGRAEALELLEQAGFGPAGRPFPTLELHYNTQELHRAIAEQVADDWRRQLGIRVKLLNQEWKVYLDTQNRLGYDISRSSWIGDYGDANTFLDVFVGGGENNRTGWSQVEYDDLISRAAEELDLGKRAELLRSAETLLMEQLPILPIFYYTTQNVVAPRLGGFAENVLDEHFLKFLYWKDDAELGAELGLAADAPSLAEYFGPRQGLYSPTAARTRRN